MSAGVIASHYVDAAAGGGAASYWTAVLADSPWGAWKTNETSGTTLADSSGNARDLTITGTGTATLAQTGPDGTTADAIAWPASALYADQGSLFNGSAFTFTFTCWVYVPSGGISAITPLVGVNNGGSSTSAILFFDAAGKINGRVAAASGSELITSASTLSTGWHHVVHSCGPDGQKLRVDKTTLATGTKTSTNTGTGVSFRVHGHGTYANANGDGAATIARVAAFKSVQLTDAQTDAHYNAA